MKRKPRARWLAWKKPSAFLSAGGWRSLPGADPGVFILSDGSLSGKPVLAKPLNLEELFNRYEASLPEGVKEANTRTTRP
jgi:hypothetical protein